MNHYGATVMQHWARFLPEAYAEIRNPDAFFGTTRGSSGASW